MSLQINYDEKTWFGMLETEVDKESIRKALLPELKLIKSEDLQQKVVEAWALACQMGGYDRIEEVPIPAFEWSDKTCIEHAKEAAQIVAALVDSLTKLGAELNRDYAIAGTLCHDVGEPLECRKNQKGFFTPMFQPSKRAGTFYGNNPNMPAIEPGISYQIVRHPTFGVYVTMAVGMPEHVVHIVATHSYEGEVLWRSPEAALVHDADFMWWTQTIRFPYPAVPEWRISEPVHWWEGRSKQNV